MSQGIKVLRWQRRAEVVTKASLPCLAAYHTLNLTAGCPHCCATLSNSATPLRYPVLTRHHVSWYKKTSAAANRFPVLFR
jgi:hypothetical protein